MSHLRETGPGWQRGLGLGRCGMCFWPLYPRSFLSFFATLFVRWSKMKHSGELHN